MGTATCCTRGKLKKFPLIFLVLKPDSNVIIASDYKLCFYKDMRVLFFLILVFCLMGCNADLETQQNIRGSRLKPMLDAQTGRTPLQAWPIEDMEKPSITVTFLPGPHRQLDVVYDFASPIARFEFARPIKVSRELWWSSTDPDVTLSEIDGVDTLEFTVPKKTVRFSLSPTEDLLSLHPTPVQFFRQWGASVFSNNFHGYVKRPIKLDGTSTGYPLRSVHNFRMVSPYPVLEGREETLDDGSIYFIHETQNFEIMSSSNTKPIISENYTLLIDPSFREEIRDKIATSTSRAIAHFNKAFGNLPTPHFVLAIAKTHKNHTGRSTGIVNKRHSMIRLSTQHAFMRKWKKSSPSNILLHEIAHLYQSAFPASPTRLLSEGGATAMSYTAEYELGYITEYVYRLKFQNARKRCVMGMDKFVEDALSFREMLQKRNSLNYDCGAALLDLILKAYPEETIYSLWKKLSFTSESYIKNTNLKIILALKDNIPKTAFLNELKLFLIDPHPDPAQSFLDLEAAISIPNPTASP